MAAFVPLVELFVLSGSLSAGVAAWVVWQRRGQRGALTFAALMTVAAVWTFASAAALASGTFDAKLFWHKVGAVPSYFIPALWVLFAIEYTGRSRTSYRRLAVLLGAEALAMGLLTLTNEQHWLVWHTYRYYIEPASVLGTPPGSLYVLHELLTYGLILAGLTLLLRVLVNARDAQRTQAGAIVVAAMLPIAVNLTYLLDLVPQSGVDYTPLGFGLASVVAGWALYRYRLFDIYPVARDAVMVALRDPVVVLDAEGTVVDYNPAARSLLGPDEPVGTPVERALPGNLPALDVPAEGATHEMSFDVDGERRHYRLDVAPMAAMGLPEGYVLVFRDETERVRNREELRRQADHLDRFASTVSHDLRNPLNLAEGGLERARDGDDEGLTLVADGLDRMEAIIEDVLTFARSGSPVEETAAVSVAETAADAWQFVDGPEATLAIAGDVAVEGDEMRIRRLLENLFRNAVEQAGPDARVEVGRLDGAGFYVADDGPGIPTDERKTVFERGYTTDADGTGFGLSIVRTIATAHGWEVRAVDPATGRGARFEITGCTTVEGSPPPRPADGD